MKRSASTGAVGYFNILQHFFKQREQRTFIYCGKLKFSEIIKMGQESFRFPKRGGVQNATQKD